MLNTWTTKSLECVCELFRVIQNLCKQKTESVRVLIVVWVLGLVPQGPINVPHMATGQRPLVRSTGHLSVG